jgi:signal transduction histidine kinase/DNA-binding NarL/FixJ family response regulator
MLVGRYLMINFKNLFRKSFAKIITLLLGFTFVITFISLMFFRHHIEREYKSELLNEANSYLLLIGQTNYYNFMANNIFELKKNIKHIHSIKQFSLLEVKNQSGRVIFEFMAQNSQVADMIIVEDFVKSKGQQERPIGHIKIGLSTDAFRSKTYIASLQYGLVIFAIFLLTSFFIWHLFKYLRRPTDTLIHWMKNIDTEQDKFTEKIDLKSLEYNYEMWTLGNFLEALVQKLFSAKSKIKEKSILEGIGQLNQMIAHDVRQPFSKFKLLLEQLENTNDPIKLNNLAKRFIPQVTLEITSVNEMLQDVMDIGASENLNQESYSICAIINDSLKNSVIYYPKAQLFLNYNFNHQSMLSCDKPKITRAISNILSNAIEAMNGKGEISFSTREYADGSKKNIQISIKNTNSFINEIDMKSIFEAFFTKNKKSGTGLGLAIVKKFINDHNGTIECNSSKSSGVEFIITLQASDEIDSDLTSGQDYPKNSQEIFETTDYSILNDSSIIEDLKNEIKTQPHINLLLVDDEDIYLESFISKINSLDLADNIKIFTAYNAEEAFSLISNENISAAICDIDLGPDSINGLELIKELRDRNFDAPVCIHSNRSLKSDNMLLSPMIDGADCFMSKPANTMELCQFLRDVSSSLITTSNVTNKKRILLFDDSELDQYYWTDSLKESFDVVALSTPEDYRVSKLHGVREATIAQFKRCFPTNLLG